jgi:Xaa-Pro aminopeptidase
MTYDPTLPKSSGEIRTIDPERSVEIEQKHLRIAEFLRGVGCDALLLQEPANFAWFTCGGQSRRGHTGTTTASLFITPEARVVVTNNVDSAQLFDWELSGLGFQLKERPWHEPRQVLIDDLCRGRTMCSDVPSASARCVADELRPLRLPLSSFECSRLRELGKRVAHAVEATARNFQHGSTEAEIAGEVAHRLVKHCIEPVEIQVWAKSRGRHYRHWQFGNDRVDRYCLITGVGRCDGLHAAASRIVTFGEPPEHIQEGFEKALMVQTCGLYFSKEGETVRDVWGRIAHLYEKLDHPDEWHHAEQGYATGYESLEYLLTPESEQTLEERTPLIWRPSVGPALVCDTALVGRRGAEVVTPTENWPIRQIEIKGARINRPGLLRRER